MCLFSAADRAVNARSRRDINFLSLELNRCALNSSPTAAAFEDAAGEAEGEEEDETAEVNNGAAVEWVCGSCARMRRERMKSRTSSTLLPAPRWLPFEEGVAIAVVARLLGLCGVGAEWRMRDVDGVLACTTSRRSASVPRARAVSCMPRCSMRALRSVSDWPVAATSSAQFVKS